MLGALDSPRHHGDVVCHYVGHFWYTPGYVITMVADALAPIRRQAISNHHVDSTMVISRERDIMLQPLHKQWWKEGGRPVFRWFLCHWRVRLLTMTTRYVMLMTCKCELARITRLNTCMKASSQSCLRSWKWRSNLLRNINLTWRSILQTGSVF